MLIQTRLHQAIVPCIAKMQKVFQKGLTFNAMHF